MDEVKRLKKLNSLLENQTTLLDTHPHHKSLHEEIDKKLKNESKKIMSKLERKNALELNMQDLFDEFFLEFK